MSNKLKKEIRILNSILLSDDDEKSLNVVNKLLKDYPNNLYFIKIKSIALTKLKKYKELLKLHDNYSEEIYKDKDIVHAKIEALDQLNDIKQEAIFVNKSLVYYPDDFYVVNMNDSVIEHFQSDIEDLNFLKDLLKFNPNNIEIYMTIGRILNNLGRSLDDSSRYQDAINYFDKAIELCKLNPNYGNNPSYIYLDKGESLSLLKKYDEAIKTLDLIDDEDSNAEMKFRKKAIIYRKLGDYDAALKYVDKAIEEGPGDLFFDYYLIEIKGTIYLCMKEYDLAIDCFNQDRDNNQSSYYYKALALKEKGKYLESLNCLNMIKESEYLIKQGWIDYDYQRAQKLIKEINSDDNYIF
ncbi:MAG: tetratricopeptide repeat protein [Methanobrevibacter sp.]|jgi:tetratricopeptide (TPR) repeat protein|nr:tetratricopeptide repeat protein [Methanobrevibacter sp.]